MPRLAPLLFACLGIALAPACRRFEHPHARYEREWREITAALGDADTTKDCPVAAARLVRVRGDHEVRRGGNTTVYGDAVKRWYLTCVDQAIAELTHGEDERARLQGAVRRLDAALSLPVSTLGIEDDYDGEPTLAHARRLGPASAATARADIARRLATVEAAQHERVAAQAHRIQVADAAEAKGWHVAALAAWAAVEPVEPALATRKAEAIARIAPRARAQVAVTVVLEPDAGITPAVLAAVRAHEGLRGRVDVRVVESAEEAQVRARLTAGAIEPARRTDAIAQQHTYVAGRETVDNPGYARLREQIDDSERQAERYERDADNVNCSRSAECRTRDDRRATARKHREKAARLRQEFARARPTKVVETTATHAYTAQRTTVSLRTKLAVTLALRGASARPPIEGVASVEKAALTVAANPAVQLPARTEPVPTPADLEPALRTQIVQMLVNGVRRAAPLTAAPVSQRLAAATDPLERAQHALILGLRTGTESDKAAARSHATTAIGHEPAWAEVQAALTPR